MSDTKRTAVFRFRLENSSGVPVYRQIIDQVLTAISTGTLTAGAQLPTVRQVAVDLEINPNTVVRAYRELEIREVLMTQQGMGTFITPRKIKKDEAGHERRLTRLVSEFTSRAGAEGFTTAQLIERLTELSNEQEKRR
jgi:GntR family transcriptional regulator